MNFSVWIERAKKHPWIAASILAGIVIIVWIATRGGASSSASGLPYPYGSPSEEYQLASSNLVAQGAAAQLAFQGQGQEIAGALESQRITAEKEIELQSGAIEGQYRIEGQAQSYNLSAMDKQYAAQDRAYSSQLASQESAQAYEIENARLVSRTNLEALQTETNAALAAKAMDTQVATLGINSQLVSELHGYSRDVEVVKEQGKAEAKIASVQAMGQVFSSFYGNQYGSQRRYN